MKTFSQWLNEISFSSQGAKDFRAQQSVKKREKKGAGIEECPICNKSPCVCKTAKIKNRVKI
jgi:hypothetical protein